MKSFVFTIIIVSVLLLSADVIILPKSAIKKAQKCINEVWPDDTLKTKEIIVEDSIVKNLGLQLKKHQLFQVNNNSGNKLGYMLIEISPSKIDDFHWMMITNTDLVIQKVKVLQYLETRGSEICSKRWLKQFEGKSPKQIPAFNKNIDGISGATISSRSITRDVGIWLQNLQKLKDNKTI